jgi:methionyl-tRNA synthetase
MFGGDEARKAKEEAAAKKAKKAADKAKKKEKKATKKEGESVETTEKGGSEAVPSAKTGIEEVTEGVNQAVLQSS